MDTNSRMHTVLVAILLVLVTGSVAFGDRVRINLSDGTRWRGETGEQISVVHKVDGAEQVTVGTLVKATDLLIQLSDIQGAEDATPMTILVARILSISEYGQEANESSSSDTQLSNSSTEASSGDTPADQPASGDNVRGVYVLPLTGMVGLEFRSDEIRKMAEEADKRGHGQIIVLHIDSGGGSALECEIIVETMEEIKKRHRVVAWIKSAISAAANTSLCCHEIYFQTGGTCGASTGYSPATGESMKGAALQLYLDFLAGVCVDGNRSPHIGRAMIDHRYSLSYTRNEETGDVTWFNDLSGDVVLSGPGENLVFTVSTALDSKFADGQADTVEELANQLELENWVEVSDYGRNLHERWVTNIEQCQAEIRLLLRDTQIKSFPNERARIGWLIERNKKFIRWLDRCPPAAQQALGGRDREYFERENKHLQKRLRDMRY